MASLPKMRSFLDQDLMVSLEVPEGWETLSNQDFVLLLSAPAENDHQAMLGFNAGAANPPTPPTMQNLFNQLEASDEQRYPGYKLVKKDKFDLNGNPGLYRIHQWVSPEGNVPMVQYQAAVLMGPKVYAANANYLKKLESKYQPIMEHIIHSMRVIPAKA